MIANELGRILKEMYEKAQRDYQVANIHLFGIKHADEIEIRKVLTYLNM